MATVVLRRLLALVPLFFGLSIGLFAISLQLNPDKAATIRAGGTSAASTDVIESVREELNLDDPVVVRYLRWLGDAVTFDLGESLTTVEAVDTEDGTTELRGVKVTSEIARALPRTLSIVLVGVVFGSVAGITVGLIGGLRPGSILDRISVLLTTAGVAVPSFWLLMLLIVWFAVDRNWLPATGYTPISSGVWPWLRQLIIPGVAVGTPFAAVTARQLRASLMDAMGNAYIRTAWAKGGSTTRVVARHALRNAAIAPLTVTGNQLAHMIGGTIVIESLVGIQGVGSLVVSAVRANDITMIQGFVLFFAFVTVLINLVIDLLHSYLNPKVRIT
jgi:peptide/nickel transport system permease protein